jgi:hypothetical protein
MELNVPAAIATAVILLLALAARWAYGKLQARLAALQHDARQAGRLEGERIGRTAGMYDGLLIGHARGAGETETRLRKEIARAYERGCAETLASLEDFERAEHGGGLARTA